MDFGDSWRTGCVSCRVKLNPAAYAAGSPKSAGTPAGGAACRCHGRVLGSLVPRRTAGVRSAMTIGNHLETFAGYPVRDYDADIGVAAGGRVARREYRLTEG